MELQAILGIEQLRYLGTRRNPHRMQTETVRVISAKASNPSQTWLGHVKRLVYGVVERSVVGT
jgi:hypothetical protein